MTERRIWLCRDCGEVFAHPVPDEPEQCGRCQGHRLLAGRLVEPRDLLEREIISVEYDPQSDLAPE